MIYVSCGGYLDRYENMRKVVEFYKEAAAWCEGSERERYMNIILQAIDNIDKKSACLRDGIPTFGFNFNINDTTKEELDIIQKNFHLTTDEVLIYMKRYNERKEKGMI